MSYFCLVFCLLFACKLKELWKRELRFSLCTSFFFLKRCMLDFHSIEDLSSQLIITASLVFK